MRPYAAAGLLIVPAAVLTASAAAHPQPVVPPSLETTSTGSGLHAGDAVRGASFESPMRDLVGYDPTADIVVAQADAGTELAGIDAHTGVVRWRRQLDTTGEYGTVLWSQSDLGAGSVLVNSFHRDTKTAELTALSTRTGEVRWRMPLTTRTEAMAAGPAMLVGEPAEHKTTMQWADPRDAPKVGQSRNPTGKSDTSGADADNEAAGDNQLQKTGKTHANDQAQPDDTDSRPRTTGQTRSTEKAAPATSWGPRAAKTPTTTAEPKAGATPRTNADPNTTSGAAHKMRAGTSPTPSAGSAASASPKASASADPDDERGSGRSRIGHTDDDAGAVATRGGPGPGTISAVAAGDGGRLWSAELPENCDLRAAGGDGRTTALRLACDDGDRLEIRDARTGTLRSQTKLDPNADDGGLGLLVRDGATLVRGARTFQVFGPDGRRLVQREGDGCAEYCDLAVEGEVAIVAQSGGSTDLADGALEAFALADGSERWRAERTVRALVREGGRLYAVGPAPQPVPFATVSGVGEHGVSAAYATTLPAGALPQRGSAMLVSDGERLSWYRIRPIEQVPGYLGGAVERPDPCRVLSPAEVAKQLGGKHPTAHRDDDATCTFTAENDRDTLRVQVLWAGTDEASTIKRYDIVKRDGVQRVGSVIVAAEKAAT